MNRNQLLEYCNNLLRPDSFEDYAPNGLQIEGNDQIKKIAFSVSASLDAIEQSIEWGADTLFVHHGLFWKYQGAKVITGPHFQRISNLIKNNINLIAYHLPLDGHQEIGNARSLSDFLELDYEGPFGEYKKVHTGTKAKLPTPMKGVEFKKFLEKKLNRPITLASHDELKEIKTIGIITGGANNDWIKAKESHLDAFLTGEISEYNWHDSIEAGINFYACGHHTTERFGVQSLQNLLKKEFKIVTKFFDSNNPV